MKRKPALQRKTWKVHEKKQKEDEPIPDYANDLKETLYQAEENLIEVGGEFYSIFNTWGVLS